MLRFKNYRGYGTSTEVPLLTPYAQGKLASTSTIRLPAGTMVVWYSPTSGWQNRVRLLVEAKAVLAFGDEQIWAVAPSLYSFIQTRQTSVKIYPISSTAVAVTQPESGAEYALASGGVVRMVGPGDYPPFSLDAVAPGSDVPVFVERTPYCSDGWILNPDHSACVEVGNCPEGYTSSADQKECVPVEQRQREEMERVGYVPVWSRWQTYAIGGGIIAVLGGIAYAIIRRRRAR